MSRVVIRRSDGKTIDLEIQDAEQVGLTAKAKRTILVDSAGDEISLANPLPTTATITTGDISIGAVELKNATDDTRAVVKSDGINNALVVTQNSQPLPSGGSTSSLQTDIKTQLQIINSLVPAIYDNIGITYPTTSSEVYIYKIGGTTVSTITVAYTDAVTKLIIASITKT